MVEQTVKIPAGGERSQTNGSEAPVTTNSRVRTVQDDRQEDVFGFMPHINYPQASNEWKLTHLFQAEADAETETQTGNCIRSLDRFSNQPSYGGNLLGCGL